MMQIGNINAAGSSVSTAKTQAGAEQANMAPDSASKDIQSKILNAQKQRQGLSFNMEMTAEEKANIRQKIEQEISDLKRELRQREAEEKKKQQEADKAIAEQEEQQENAAREAVKEQQNKIQPAQDSTVQQQENISAEDGRTETERLEPDDKKQQTLPNELHKAVSTNSSIQQFYILNHAAAHKDRIAKVQEAELELDAVRGADVEAQKKQQQEAIQKETKRMESVQAFMFRATIPATDPATGAEFQFTGGASKKGLYSNQGTLFKNNFHSVQMDVKQ